MDDKLKYHLDNQIEKQLQRIRDGRTRQKEITNDNLENMHILNAQCGAKGRKIVVNTEEKGFLFIGKKGEDRLETFLTHKVPVKKPLDILATPAILVTYENDTRPTQGA